jgi:YgiT-type zinc finger domain-containing protein
LSCPKCKTKYVETTTNFEYGDIILKNVKALKCPECKEELYTPEQYSEIRARIKSITQTQPLKLKRKISTAGNKPIVYLPEDIVHAADLKKGDEIEIYVEGKKIVIEKT